MLQDRTVAVVVPAFNEETQIELVLSGIPDFVDRVVVVDDLSSDSTSAIVLAYREAHPISRQLPAKPDSPASDPLYDAAERAADRIREEEECLFTPAKVVADDDDRVVLIQHTRNGGVGAAIATGYKWCRDRNIDCTVVMAGDGQMDPRELPRICQPVIDGEVDYVKGNRLIHRAANRVIPKARHFGNAVLSILTKIASGYWHISDTQTGYTAINLQALRGLDLHRIYPRYGMPNDILIRLNIGSFTIKEVPIKPVYNVGEQSKMKIGRVAPKIILLLVQGFFRRLFTKYLAISFHPLFICYMVFFLLSALDTYLIGYMVQDFFVENVVNKNYLIVTVFISGLLVQFLLFGMWFDMQDNERLHK